MGQTFDECVAACVGAGNDQEACEATCSSDSEPSTPSEESPLTEEGSPQAAQAGGKGRRRGFRLAQVQDSDSTSDGEESVSSMSTAAVALA